MYDYVEKQLRHRIKSRGEPSPKALGLQLWIHHKGGQKELVESFAFKEKQNIHEPCTCTICARGRIKRRNPEEMARSMLNLTRSLREKNVFF